MNNNDNNNNKQSGLGGTIGNAVGGAAKMGMKQLGALIKKKLLLLIAPALPYIFIIGFSAIAVIAIFSNFNNIFSLITGRDPMLSQDNENDNQDINNNERIPGQELADDFVSTYDEPGTGLEKLEECDPNRSLGQWLTELFTDNFTTVCSMINYIQKTANDLEDDYDFERGDLDRGLVVSSLLYAYVYRDVDIEGEPDPNDPVLSSGDPLTVFNHMIESESGVKIKTGDIETMFKHQAIEKKFVALTWGVVRTEPVYKEGTNEIDYEEKYYGCKSEVVTGYELDLDKYRIFLRDRRDEIIGKVESATAVEPEMQAYGYVGAKNYYLTIQNSTGFCTGGEPILGEHEYLETENGSDYVTMRVAQAFIKDIVDNKKHDYQAFLTKADYNVLTKDNLSFTYNGRTYTIDYNKGFLNEKFSYMQYEGNETFKPKRGEQIIDIIFSNSAHMNASLNFPYTTSSTGETNVTSLAVVVGDEANPVGDFPYVVSSDGGFFGMRYHPITGVYKMHNGIDMAGSGINGSGVYAWKAGVVVRAGYDVDCGNFVRIKHETVDGTEVQTLYCHLLEPALVSSGQEVAAGRLIGKVGSTGGSTGPHLHFQIEVAGTPVDPCDYIKVGRTCAEVR